MYWPPATDLLYPYQMRIWAGSYHHHLPEKMRNTFFQARVVNAFSWCIPHLWLFSLLGACSDRKMLCVLHFIHCFLQMCSLVFVNDSFSFSWSTENLQIIMAYIPAQNRAKCKLLSGSVKHYGVSSLKLQSWNSSHLAPDQSLSHTHTQTRHILGKQIFGKTPSILSWLCSSVCFSTHIMSTCYSSFFTI